MFYLLKITKQQKKSKGRGFNLILVDIITYLLVRTVSHWRCQKCPEVKYLINNCSPFYNCHLSSMQSPVGEEDSMSYSSTENDTSNYCNFISCSPWRWYYYTIAWTVVVWWWRPFSATLLTSNSTASATWLCPSFIAIITKSVCVSVLPAAILANYTQRRTTAVPNYSTSGQSQFLSLVWFSMYQVSSRWRQNRGYYYHHLAWPLMSSPISAV